jgi:hypothetical protein
MEKQVKLLQAQYVRVLEDEINELNPHEWVMAGPVTLSTFSVGHIEFMYVATMVRPEGYVTQEQKAKLKAQEERLKDLYANMEDALTALELTTGADCSKADYEKASTNADNADKAIKSYRKSIGQIPI